MDALERSESVWESKKSEQLKNNFIDYATKLKRRALCGLLSTEEGLQLIKMEKLSIDFTEFLGLHCRICLQELEEGADIFSLDEDLLKTFKLLTLNVSKNDGFSQKICLSCIISLQSIHNTLSKWNHSQYHLLEKLAHDLKEEERLYKEEEEEGEIEEYEVIEIETIDENIIMDPDTIVEVEKAKKPHICGICEKVLKTSLALKVHQRCVHSDDRPFWCQDCGKRFKTHSAIVNHRAIHQDKTFACSDCSYRGNTKANLKSHLKSHRRDKNYKCQQCGSLFTTSSNLAKHIRNIHRAEKRYKCADCDKLFSTRESALKHGVTHSKSKIFACPSCNVTYAWYNALQKHLKSQHPGVKSMTEKKFIDLSLASVE